MLNELVEVTIEKVVAGGEGLARHAGKVVFVPLALPGERVIVKIVQSKRDFARSELVRVITAHPERVAPACPHYQSCGGCDLQQASYPLQMVIKQAIVAEAWQRLAHRSLPATDFFATAPWRYRTRMQLHQAVGQAGFMGRDGRSIIPVPQCQTVAEPLVAQLRLTQPAAVSEAGSVRQNFVLTDQGLTSDPTQTEARITVAGQTLYFDPQGFFQSNLEGLAILTAWLLRHLPPIVGKASHLLDLYGGVGTFSVLLKPVWESTSIVENDARLLALARQNLADRRAEFFAGSVEAWLSTRPRPAKYWVLVDPPREGLSADLRRWLIRQKPHCLVYIACNPVTQARDLAELLDGGYQVAQSAIFDFYPQTAHIETAVILQLPVGS
jgi:23S rRNA (uracil1939-C5)-methyltransferase